jgi:heat shock protein HslJ
VKEVNQHKLIFTLIILSVFAAGCSLVPSRSQPVKTPTIEAVIPTEDTSEDANGAPVGEVDQPVEKTIFVGPHQVECMGVAPQLCYQVKEDIDAEWSLFYDQIDGFEWQGGYFYELRVAVFEVEDSPADASSLRYALIEVVSLEQVVDEAPKTYIDITSPLQGAALDPGQPIVVTGMGAGLFEGNVVVQVENSSGGVIALDATIIDSPDAGTGGEGPWGIEFRLEGIVPTEGVITAFSPSPEDGSWMASDSVDVVFSPSEVQSIPLEGTNWLLVGLGDGILDALLSVHQVTISFDPESKSLAGASACNSYFASYELDGEKINLGPVGSTMMMCDDDRMTVEDAYLGALAEVAGHRFEEGDLVLVNAGGEMLLRFKVDPLG